MEIRSILIAFLHIISIIWCLIKLYNAVVKIFIKKKNRDVMYIAKFTIAIVLIIMYVFIISNESSFVCLAMAATALDE